MKKVMVSLFAGISIILFISCGEAENTAAAEETKDAPKAELPKIPYELGHPIDNWVQGNMENIPLVLNSLKAWEERRFEESIAAFADSVQLEFDGMEKKLPKDSLLAWMKGEENKVRIVLQDVESVKSKDGKDEYVSIWYKEIRTSPAGKVDSMELMDDAKIENGKIILLNSKSRKYPK